MPGPGLDPKTFVGPLVSAEQHERVSGYIDAGARRGRARRRRRRPTSATAATSSSPRSSRPPTTTRRSCARRSSARCSSPSPTTSLEEVAERANDGDYGLAAGVWTRDVSNAHRLASLLRAGSVYVNTLGRQRPGARRSAASRPRASAASTATTGSSAYLETKTRLHRAVSEPPGLPGVTHRYVDAAGLRVHVAEAGDPDAPPVVLLHGWPQHWWMWRKVIPLLAGDHRVMCPDLRGHGWTDAPPRRLRQGAVRERPARDARRARARARLPRRPRLGRLGGVPRVPARARALRALPRAQHPPPVAAAEPARRAAPLAPRTTSWSSGAPGFGQWLLRTHAGGSCAASISLDGPDPSAWTDADLRLFSDRCRSRRGPSPARSSTAPS